ncbi:MAG: hypothetical protein JJ902_04850 [Roseibium sp.]|nr:hypothetical protein [Roseibium sp.]
MGHGHHHHHHHDHEHGPHDHGPGHNHRHADHLHSHVHAGSRSGAADELRTLATSFIDGFRSAPDKTSYLRLAGIPFHREGEDGLIQHLVDAQIVSNWQIGTASPAFASRELVYMPFPGEMVKDRETMTFVYVSLTARADVDLITLLSEKLTQEPNS